MNLIDILNQILSTKNEIKDIIKKTDASDDISRFPVTIHNYLTELYNKGFMLGYKSKWLELQGSEAVVASPRDILQYSNADKYYSSYDVDVLTDIMRDVLNYRVGMKTEIGTSSDYFPSYPDSLRSVISTIESAGYADGENAAISNSQTGITNIETPRLTYSNNVFYLYSSQNNVKMYYAFGDENDPTTPWTVYQGKGVIMKSTWIYTKAKYNGLESPVSDPGYWCKYVEDGYKPGTGTPTPSTGTEDPITPPGGGNPGGSGSGTGDGPGSTPGTGGTTVDNNTPYEPYFTRNGNNIYIQTQSSNCNIFYRLNHTGVFTAYNGSPITITENTTFEAYAAYVSDPYLEHPSGTVTYNARYIDPTNISENENIPAVPDFTKIGNKIFITCNTDGAKIYYRINSTGDFVEYTYGDNILVNSNLFIEAYSTNEKYGITYTSDTASRWFYPSDSVPSGPGTGEGGDPGGWTGGGDTNPIYEHINTPKISCDGKNVISLSNLSSGVTTWVWHSGGEGWSVYSGPFRVYQDDGAGKIRVIAYSTNGYVTSPNATATFDFVPEEDWPDYYVEVPTMSVSDDYNVSLACTTSGATIYYQIGPEPDESGLWRSWSPDQEAWVEYTGTFTLADEDRLIWTYATKNDSNWADSHTATYIYYAPRFVILPPDEPVIQYFDLERTRVIITAQYGVVYYKYGPSGDWIQTNSSNPVISPQEKCVIYAKAHSTDTDLESDVVTFDFDGLDHLYSLIAPEISYNNNRFTITNPNGDTGVIFYTMDGSDPYDQNHMYNNINGAGIPYSENVYVRAIVVDTASDMVTRKSRESNKWCIYDEDTIDWTEEYFAVKGATEIHVTGNSNNVETLCWSYDKINWTNFSNSATGLNPDRWVYLNTTINGKYWDSMYFGPDDSVTIAGNIYTLVLNGRRFPDSLDRDYMFSRMFEGCTQLVDATNLNMTFSNLRGHDFMYMFKDCVNLVSGPKSIPNVHNLEVYSCQGMFQGCTKLEYIGNFDIKSVKGWSCNMMFKDCVNLKSFNNINIDSDIPISAFEEAFSGCTSLLNVSMNITGDIVGANAFKKCFFGCSSLSSTSSLNTIGGEVININLNSENVYENCYESMFEGCSSMTSFGTLPATTLANYAYRNMFTSCTSLTKAPILFGINLKNGCYYGMFSGCTSLEKAPDLIAESLGNGLGCYDRMFKGCSKLNYIYAAFLDDISTYKTTYTYEWVDGVAESGTFVQNEDATWFETGIHAIPETWVTSGGEGRVGKVVDIDCVYTTVTITASNDDAIFYRINGGEWNLYNGPFEIFDKSSIEARCRNARGDYGDIYTETVKPSIPEPVITQSGNTITISAPDGFKYDVIYFSINYFDWGNNIIPPDYVEVYSGPFDIVARSYIHAQGMYNNHKSEYSHWMAETHVQEPDIKCENNIISISVDIPESVDYRILYKINDIEDSVDGWNIYSEPFVIRESDMVDGKVTITAKTGVYSIGGERFSDLVTVDCVYDPNGASYVLHVPVLKQYDGSNLIYLMYGGRVFQTWTDNNIGIKYKIGENGQWVDYMHQFNIDEDCTIYIYAYDSKTSSIIANYSFTYNPDIETVVVPSPNYSIRDDGGDYDYLYLSNTLNGTTNYFRVTNPTWLYGDYDLSSWSGVGYGGYQLYPLTSGKIWAISSIIKDGLTYFSDTVSVDYVCGHTYESVMGLPRVSFDRSTNIVTINPGASGVKTYYRINNTPQRQGTLYNGPFTIEEDCTIHAWNVSIDDETKKSNEYTLFCDYKLNASVSILFEGNTFSLVCSPDGLNLQYSFDGSSWSHYSGPVYTDGNVTVYARAYKDTSNAREYSDTVTLEHEYSEAVIEPSYSIDYTTQYPTVTLNNYTGKIHINSIYLDNWRKLNESSIPWDLETINVYYNGSWHNINKSYEDRYPNTSYWYFEFEYSGPFMVECNYTYCFAIANGGYLKKPFVSGSYYSESPKYGEYKDYIMTKGAWVSNLKPLQLESVFDNDRTRSYNIVQTSVFKQYGWNSVEYNTGAAFGPIRAGNTNLINGMPFYTNTTCYRINGGDWVAIGYSGESRTKGSRIYFSSLDYNQIEIAPCVIDTETVATSSSLDGRWNIFIEIGPITKYYREEDRTINAPIVRTTPRYSEFTILNYNPEYDYYWFIETIVGEYNDGMTIKYPNYVLYGGGTIGGSTTTLNSGTYGIFATRKNDGTYRSAITRFIVTDS